MSLVEYLWNRLNSVQAPIHDDLTRHMFAPAAPMSQEEFADGAVAPQHLEIEALKAMHERIVRANNDHVTRDYGFGPVTEHEAPNVEPMTAEDLEFMRRSPSAWKYLSKINPTTGLPRDTDMSPGGNPDQIS